MGINDMTRHAGTVLCLAALCQGLVCIGCGPAPERSRALGAIARWEDRRLADTDSLITMMKAPDAHVRRAAMRAAGLIGRSDVQTELIEGLDDPSEAVAIEAATALGFLDEPDVAAPLADKLAAAGPNLRRAILFALGRAPNDGTVLAGYALNGRRAEAALAWDGLRNHATELDSTVLHRTLDEGLALPDADLLWRVLRCAERSNDASLVPKIAGFTTADDVQTAVHACRALGRLATDDPRARADAIDALDRAWARADDAVRSSRDRMRLRIAVLGALGRLAGPELSRETPDVDIPAVEADAIARTLAAGIRDENTHVRRTALETTARLVGPLRLAVEAAERESLLPVWRIRLLHAAAAHLMPMRDGRPDPANAPEPIIRAAAAGACCALRGPGIETGDLWPALLTDRNLLVQSAMADGMARYCLEPEKLLKWSASLNAETPERLKLAATDALTAAWRRYHDESRPAEVIDAVRDEIDRVLDLFSRGRGASAANAAIRMGAFPSARNLERLCRIHDAAPDTPAGVDIRLGVLSAMTQYLGGDGFDAPDSLLARTRDIIERGFDAPTINLRLAAREAATAGDLVPENAIPTEASLRATLPAVRRDPRQAPTTLPFDAPKVRCVTARGDFVIELDGRRAPNTSATFLRLIEEGFYENLKFHRVVPDFVIQGGCPEGTGWGSPGFTIRSEWSRRPYRRGTVGIAHSGKDTGGSQFFVALSPQPHLDGRYTVFGTVVSGMKVAEMIQPDDTFRLVIEP